MKDNKLNKRISEQSQRKIVINKKEKRKRRKKLKKF